MNAKGEPGKIGIDFIDILIFSMGENRFAVDMAQINKITEVSKKKGSGTKFSRFHEKAGFREKDYSYRAPKAIFLKDCNENEAILIDSPEDIIPLSVGHIRPMPYLIDCCSKQKAIWGATFINDEIVFLVDLQRLREVKGTKQ